MKYSVTVKFIAILLCACSLVAVAFSGLGIAFMEGYDLYKTPLETVQRKEIDGIANQIAWEHAQRYALETLSNAPQELIEQIYGGRRYSDNLYGQYAVEIRENGRVVSEGGVEQRTDFGYVVTLQPSYPVVTSSTMEWEEIHNEPIPEDIPAETQVVEEESLDLALARVADQEVLYSEEFSTGYSYDSKTNRYYETVYSINYYHAPEYEVQVWLAEDVLMGPDYMLITALYPYRDYFIPVVLAALAAFAISFVFLCTVAGRTKNGEVKLAAINRIPLDLYGVCMAGLAVLLFMPLIWLFEEASYYTDGSRTIWDNPYLCLLICCLSGLGMAVCIIGFLYAFAAQVKASDNYWLRHTVVGWCLRQIGMVLRWAGKGFAALGKAFRTAGRGIRAVFLMLPTIWQWIVTAAVMVICPVAFLLFASVSWSGFWTFFWGFLFFGCLVVDVVIVLYGGWCFGTLLKGIETMSNGDLNYKINTRFLYGSFREFGEELNSLAEAAKLAAENQMKSERMRTELITNVSHDIKTPLTSIINFVDLMKKPHSEEDGREYLAVLDRQSQRLKKLIDDLMDMSKASSGNMTLELGEIDAAEAVNQALGEFADKLDRVGLTPVFRHPEGTVLMRADGKHLWRVLSNLLGNAVKYALPDTRLYIDLMELQGNAVIAIKNISREQLNVDAEELMERFVRGDASRNTEGSGLGLNIAKSLVELQGGQMHLMVDGDLFKVTLIFPLA